jgi:hypothetical protein
MPVAPAVRVLMIFLALLALESPLAPATAEIPFSDGPGFWEGLLHGFLSLPKLLISPFVEVTLVDSGAHLFSYDIGFFVGVLLFASAGAAAAASTPNTGN